MASENDDLEIRLGVNDGEVQPRMNAAANAIQNAVDGMRNSFGGLASSVTNFQGIFIGAITALASGALFKSSINDMEELSDKVRILSIKMGITREEASALTNAIEDIGLTTDAYIGMATKLDRQLRTNEEGLRAVGIETRGANKEYANQKDILNSAFEMIMKYKEGTDRNLASMFAFGRGTEDVIKMMRMNDEVMQGATDTVNAFGLVMGKDIEENLHKYKLAIDIVDDATLALKVTIGKAFLPVMVEMTDFLNDNGIVIMGLFEASILLVKTMMETLIGVLQDFGGIAVSVFSGVGEIISAFTGDSISGLQFFKDAVDTTRTAFILFGALVQQTCLLIKGAIEMFVVEPARRMGAVLSAVFKGDWEGAKAAWSSSATGFQEINTRISAEMVASAKTAADKIKDIWTIKPGAKLAGPPEAGDGGAAPWVQPDTKGAAKGAKTKTPKDMAAAQLGLDKAEFEAALSELKDNLDRSQALYDDAYSRNIISTKEYYDAKLYIETAGMEKELETKKREMAAAEGQLEKAQSKKTPEGERDVLRFRTELAKMTSELTILESHLAEATINNNTKRIAAEKERVDQITEISIRSKESEALTNLELDMQTNDALHAAGIMSNLELLALERGFQTEKTEIQKQAVKERMLLENDPQAIAALNEQLLQLARQHALSMGAISNKLAAEINRPYLAIQASLKSSLNSTIQSLLAGTMTLSNALKGILGSIADSLIMELVTKPLTAKISAWAMEKILNMGAIGSSAGVAGAEAVKAVAGIPVIGPALAAVAGPATYALAMGFGTMSAAQGYDVPANVNPMTQIHQKEMVLPEELAENVRKMSGNSRSNFMPNITINATDAESVRRLFQNNGAALIAALRKQGRNFAI